MNNIYLALVDIRSLENIGAIFRTASFFGVYNILLVGYSGKDETPKGEKILHQKISKSSLGSEKDLKITMLEDENALVEFSKINGLSLVCIEQDIKSIKLNNFKIARDAILVFGNEVTGVSKKLLEQADDTVEIKRLGIHNSLNITTALGITLYQITQ